MTYEQIVDDVARSFLIAIRDALKRRKVNVANLDFQISALGPPRVKQTAFVNLLGDINPHREEEELTGLEVVLSLPLSGEGVPTEADIDMIEKVDRLLSRRLKAVAEVEGHESGSGSAEFFLLCDKHGPVIEVLREMVRKDELPKTATALARNLKTDSERAVSLKPKTR
ncbi:MAG: hypothetical protein IPM33_09505 [Phycisphaerales bacterium]|nr:hypothetical protein [Phycisphaerales bacterium]